MSQADLPLRAYEGVALPQRRARPLAVMFGAVYLTVAATLLVEPQPVLDWLDDLDPSPVVSAARVAMVRVAAVSDALGLSPFSQAVRGRAVPFLKRPEASPS